MKYQAVLKRNTLDLYIKQHDRAFKTMLSKKKKKSGIIQHNIFAKCDAQT